jgi:hypothetical protein
VQESDGLKTSYVHTRALPFTSGSQQKYRVKPKNNIGYGSVFGEGLILADEKPISMSTPTRGTVHPNSI